MLQGPKLLAHGLQEGVALAAAIFIKRAARGCGSVRVFLGREHVWSWRLGKRRRSIEAVEEEEEFPPLGWLSGTAALGQPRARCRQRDTAGGIPASVCYSRVGECSGSEQPLPAAIRGSHRVGLAGKAAVLLSLLWAGRHCRAGSQRRKQPLNGGEKRNCPAGGLFLSGFRLVCVEGSCLSKAAQFHKAGSVSLNRELFITAEKVAQGRGESGRQRSCCRLPGYVLMCAPQVGWR